MAIGSARPYRYLLSYHPALSRPGGGGCVSDAGWMPYSGSVSTCSPRVSGLDLDEQTRCRHYHSLRDIVAIKMRCCGEYYACRECHDALAAHDAAVWPRTEWDTLAILCGSCRNELTITQYLESAHRCPICTAEFNPGCRSHHPLYFAH